MKLLVIVSVCDSLVELFFFFFFSSRRRHTRFDCDWSSDVCSSDLGNRQSAQVLLVAIIVLGFQLEGIPRVVIGHGNGSASADSGLSGFDRKVIRSEERRVGEEGRSPWAPYH